MMVRNLEDIRYAEVLHPRGASYEDWRKKLKPDYFIVYRDIILGYLAIALVLFFSSLIKVRPPLVFIIGVFLTSILIGFLLAYLSLFLHEAGHFNLHTDKKKNDLLAVIFICSVFGIDIRSYRKIHWQHHMHLGTPGDTEISYYQAPDATYFFESLTGVHLIRIIRNKKTSSILTNRMKRDSLRMLAIGAILNLMIVALLLIAGFWASAISWAIGMLVFFPFFASIRQILEHRSEHANKKEDYSRVPHGKFSRLFSSDLFSKIFGGAGFNKHMIHHWDPQVSYTLLNEIEEFLRQCEATSDVIESSKTTYFKTLRKLSIKKPVL
jgi:fatty acid desaturase